MAITQSVIGGDGIEHHYHDITLAEIKQYESQLAELAENERYIDGSGYNFEDYLDEVDKGYWTAPRTDGKKWTCGSSMETPEIKALQKIYRRVCREMKSE